MSAESDARFAALAKRLIDANGRTITVISSSGKTYTNPDKPWLGVSAETITFDLVGVFTNVEKSMLDSLDDSRSLTIGNDIRGLILPASDVTVDITTNDKIVDGSKRYEVLNVKKIQPGSGVIIYKLVVGG